MVTGVWPAPRSRLVAGSGAGTREIVVEDGPPWGFERDPLTALIDAQQGVIARWQALRLLTRKAIEHRVTSRRWRRVHRGVYLAYGGPITLSQRHWIAVLSGSPGPTLRDGAAACLGGVSALQVHGLQRITAPRIDLVIPSGRRLVTPGGVVTHRCVDIDRHPGVSPPTTTVGRAVIDAASWARSDDEARLIVVASFQQRLVTAAEIHPLLDRMPTVPRRRLIVLTVNDAGGGSHTLGELSLLELCRRARLPAPTRQLVLRDLAGRPRHLDAVFDPWKVAVEIDGAQHNGVPYRWDDNERDNALILATYRILRYPTYVVRQQPQRVAAEIRMALIQSGWRPSQDR